MSVIAELERRIFLEVTLILTTHLSAVIRNNPIFYALLPLQSTNLDELKQAGIKARHSRA